LLVQVVTTKFKSGWSLVLLLAIAVFFLSDVNLYAEPAPDISSLDIIAVGTGDDTGTAQWTAVDSPYQSTISVNAGTRLFVITRQEGYEYSSIATFNGNQITAVRTDFIYSQYPIVSGFINYWDCGSSQSGTFLLKSWSVNTYQLWQATIDITVIPPSTLSVTKLGPGDGTVTLDTGSLSWDGALGTANYTGAPLITLTATPDSNSTFEGWNGEGCTGTSTCSVTMGANRSISATFSLLPKAKILGGLGYGSITGAYLASVAGDAILVLDGEHEESLNLNLPKDIKLLGGYDQTFNALSGNPTTLNGVMTIIDGSVIVDTLVLK